MRAQFRYALVIPVTVAATALSACALDSSVRGSFQRTLKVAGPIELQVSTGSGDIVVRAGDSATVQIHGKIQAHDEWRGGTAEAEQKVRYLETHPPIEQDGSHIRVGRIEDSELSRNISIDYEITAPTETQLGSQTGSGDLTVEGIRGPVDAHTGSGDMKFSSINGDVQARSGSGDGKFEHISGERVEIESGSGDMELHDVRSALRVRTGSGNINAEGKPAGDWVLRAGSGEVTLHLPSQTGFDLVAHTSSGEINSDLPITVQGSMTHGELRGKVRGGGVRVEVNTGSGDIRID
jgi:hypothetical protein